MNFFSYIIITHSFISFITIAKFVNKSLRHYFKSNTPCKLYLQIDIFKEYKVVIKSFVGSVQFVFLPETPESEFNAFEPHLKSAKNRFQLSAGLNLEKSNTTLSGTNHI